MATSAPPVSSERQRIMDCLRAAAPQLRAQGISHLALFGSVARGEAGAASDVDLVIDLAPGRRWSLVELSEARLRLSVLLGREAGIVVRDDLRPSFRRRIEPDLVEVF